MKICCVSRPINIVSTVTKTLHYSSVWESWLQIEIQDNLLLFYHCYSKVKIKISVVTVNVARIPIKISVENDIKIWFANGQNEIQSYGKLAYSISL